MTHSPLAAPNYDYRIHPDIPALIQVRRAPSQLLRVRRKNDPSRVILLATPWRYYMLTNSESDAMWILSLLRNGQSVSAVLP